MGETERALNFLPVAALRIAPQEDVTLQRLRVKTIGQLTKLPRATLLATLWRLGSYAAGSGIGHTWRNHFPRGRGPRYATLPDLS